MARRCRISAGGFPTYTRANDMLRFSNREVRIRMTIRYSEYKQFKSTVKIIPIEPTKPEATRPARPPQK